MAAVLIERAHEVAQFDDALAIRDISSTVELVSAFRPDLVGVAVPAQQATGRTLEYVRALRRALPLVHICVGGIFATVAHEELLSREPAIDSVVRGEGELTIAKIAERLEAGRGLLGVEGVTFRISDRIVVNANRPLVRDLTTLPMPDRSACGPLLEENRRIGLYSARGCYGECSFCSLHAFWDDRCVRFRSPQQVVAEIDGMYALGVRKLRFINDIFVDGSDKSRWWLEAFCGLLRERAYDLNLWMQFRAEDVDRRTLKALRCVGLEKVLIGVESGHQLSLDAFRKHTTVEQNYSAVGAALEAAIKEVALGFIMFHPASTLEGIHANLEFLAHMPTFRYKNLFSTAAPYRGTSLHEVLVETGFFVSGENWWDVGRYRFADEMVQRLHLAVVGLKEAYGTAIWFESAVDVEERIIKGELRRRGGLDAQLSGEWKITRRMFSEFKREMSSTLLWEFKRLLIAVGNGEAELQVCDQAARDRLGQLMRDLETRLRIAQSFARTGNGFRLGIESLPDLLG